MKNLIKLTEEINLKGKHIDLKDSRYVNTFYSKKYELAGKGYGLSTHCVDCNPRDC